MSAAPEPTFPSGVAYDALAALHAAVAAKGGSPRTGQIDMCAELAGCLHAGEHLLVEAPTGTGKTYAILCAAAAWLADARGRYQQRIADGEDPADVPRPRIVVATATKALQEQLIDDDLPLVTSALAGSRFAFTYAMVKGRSNYLCRAKADDARSQGTLFANPANVEALCDWAEISDDGDRATFPGVVSDDDWRSVSIETGACPRTNCGRYRDCFAEAAFGRAGEADLVVTNTAMYAAHLATGHKVLPDHQAVIFDEAHTLASIVSSAFTVTCSPDRLRTLAGRARRNSIAVTAAASLDANADRLASELSAAAGTTVNGGTYRDIIAGVVDDLSAIAADAGKPSPSDTGRRAQLAALAGNMARDLAFAAGHDDTGRVAWVDDDGATLHDAPIHVGGILDSLLYPEVTVAATSATLRIGGRFDAPASELGMDRHPFSQLAVPSPFDHRRQGVLYVPTSLPDPRADGWDAAVVDELWTLAVAAGGRTLGLFTSWRSADAATTELRQRVAASGVDLEVLSQRDGATGTLIGRLKERRRVVICATQSWWAGVDVPGDDLVCVAIDRLPFPRPNDPLISARRDAAGEGFAAFSKVDLPVAATQLAQGVGRLIRTDNDRGVVAVFDRRLATASYRKILLDTLPPFRRTVRRDDAVEFLEQS